MGFFKSPFSKYGRRRIVCKALGEALVPYRPRPATTERVTKNENNKLFIIFITSFIVLANKFSPASFFVAVIIIVTCMKNA